MKYLRKIEANPNPKVNAVWWEISMSLSDYLENSKKIKSKSPAFRGNPQKEELIHFTDGSAIIKNTTTGKVYYVCLQ